jgi:hypothetical protein
MPEPLVLKASILKWVGMLLAGLPFSAVGLLMVGSGQLPGWFVTFFGVFVTVVSAAMLIRRGRLELSPQGMQVVHLGRRQPMLQWRYCSDFWVWAPARGAAIVVFNYAGPEKRWGWKKLAAVSRRISGGNASLPDTYGMRAEKLCEVLRAYRSQWGQPAPGDGDSRL